MLPAVAIPTPDGYNLLMADVLSKSQRSRLMRAVKGKNSKIELIVRRALWREGFRYSLHSRRYFGTPDIVLKKYKTVIFVDSCFWHGCKKHFQMPAVRVAFWRAKINTNRARDRSVNLFYRRREWTVFRFWEHDITTDITKLIQTVAIRRSLCEKRGDVKTQWPEFRPGAQRSKTCS